jgi:hypothetical protein
MQDKRVTLVVLGIVLVVGGLWVRSYFSPENVVRRSLTAAVESFEDEQLLGAVQVISRTYADQWGMTYESIAGNISELMSSFEGLDVDLEIRSIESVGGEVVVRLEFVISGREDGGSGSIVGSFADPCTATIRWRDETSGWKIFTTEALDIPELREELDRMNQ